MSIWETSNDPGSKPAITFDRDKHFPDNRPADGTAAAATNKGPQDQAKPFLTYKDGKLTVFDGGRYTIFVGVLDNGRSVALILKPDAPADMDVFNATPQWLILNSDQDVFKIVKIDTIKAHKNGNSVFGQTVVPHGLDFIPTVLAFIDNTTYFQQLPSMGFSLTTGALSILVEAEVDANNLYLNITTPSWAGNGNYTSTEDLNIKYFLLQQSTN